MRFKDCDTAPISQGCKLNTFNTMYYQQQRNKMFQDFDYLERFKLDLSTKPFEKYYGQLSSQYNFNNYPIKNVPTSTVIFNRNFEDNGRNTTLLKTMERLVNVGGTYIKATDIPRRPICNSSLGGNLPISRSNYRPRFNTSYKAPNHKNIKELHKNNDEITYGDYEKKKEYPSGENQFFRKKISS